MNDAQLVNLSVDNHCRKHFIAVNQQAIFVLFFANNYYSVPLF